MKLGLRFGVALCSILGILLVPGLVRPAEQFPVPYNLQSASTYEDGCFGACECLGIEGELLGTLDLVPTGSDEWFRYYEVSGVRWVARFPDRKLIITGDGKYQVGGDFALTHRMQLRLSIGDDPPVDFDSGLIAGGASFPHIDIVISRHGMACRDTVMHVIADPKVADVPEGPLVSGIRRISPNPFGRKVNVDLMLRRPGPVAVTVYDTQGRAVRTLARGTWLDSGVRALEWDGRRDDGTALPAGLFFVRARFDGEDFHRTVVKLP